MISGKTTCIVIMLSISAYGFGQNNVGINVQAPTQALSVDRGINIDNNNLNNGISLLNGLRFGNAEASNQTVGITSNRTGVSPYSLDFYTSNSRRMIITQGGRVGIGKLPEAYSFEVLGTLEAGAVRSESGVHANGTINADDNILAGININAGSNISAGANINAGNNITAANNIIAQNDLFADRNIIAGGTIVSSSNISTSADLVATRNVIAFTGNVSANNGELSAGGRGVVMSNSSARLKVIAYTATFSANNLAAGSSITSNINISGGNFTSNPTTYVGNVVTQNGEYYRAMVVLENVSTTNITVRVVNLHSNPISFSGAQWRILALGAF